MKLILKNKRTNHTGLSAANLALHNYWVMYRYDRRIPKESWIPGANRGGKWYFRQLLKVSFTGWSLTKCRVKVVR